MRQILVLIGSLIAIHVSSMCAWEGIWAYPKSNTMESNSWIILEGYSGSQSIIDSLNIGYPVYLECDGIRIPLSVKYRYKGQYSLTQAILIPDEELIVGQKYYLKLDSLNSNSRGSLMRTNSESKEKEPVFWVVKNEVDNTLPELLNTPLLIDKSTIRYGCGPGVHSIFKISAQEENELFVKTELIELKSGESTTYILDYDKSDTLKVGHGMCSGAFRYEKRRKYRIRFRLIDICGNESEQWSDWVEFRSPMELY